MGQMNFLKGGYTGTLGTTYGVKQRRTIFVKAKPFSHTPHNKAQKDSFSAFTCLQRFCAQVNKSFWQYTGLSDKGRNKMNVTAEFFKAMVSEHRFKFEKVLDVIPEKAEFSVHSFEFVEETQTFKIGMAVDSPYSADPTAKMFVGVFTPDGRCVADTERQAMQGEVELPTMYTNKTNAYAVAILAVSQDGKYGMIASSCHALKSEVIVGETWFPNVMGNGVWYYVEVETLKGEGVNVSYSAETLTF